MKKNSFLQYLKNTFWQFIDHVTLNKKILLLTVYETVFWLLFFATSYLTSRILKKQAAMLGKVNFDQLKIFTSQELTTTNITLIKTFLLKSILILSAFAIVILLIYSIIKGLIWLTLFDKKPTKACLIQFFKLHLIWWLLLALPIMFILAGAQPEFRTYFVIFFAVFYLHATTILQAKFTQKMSLKDAFADILNIGIAKIHYFVLPYAFSLIIYWLLTRLLYLLPSGSIALLFAAILIGLLFICWFRNYLKSVILEI